MDELAIKLKMDPLEMRMKNDAERDEGKNLPFSSRHLKECYQVGAEKIGWKQRTPQWARCAATARSSAWASARLRGLRRAFPAPHRWSYARTAASACAAPRRISARARTRCSRKWCMTKTGVPLDRIDVFLGDTSLPDGPTSGGSMVDQRDFARGHGRCESGRVRACFISLHMTPGSPFHGAQPESLTVAEGRVVSKNQQPQVVGVALHSGARSDRERRAVRRGAEAGESERHLGNRPHLSFFRRSEGAEVFSALLRRAFCRGRVGAGDCTAAGEPHLFDFRLRPHHQQEGRYESDSRRRGDGRGHGAV